MGTDVTRALHRSAVPRASPRGLPPDLSWVSRLDAPVWICGFDGTITYINSQARRLFGRDGTDEICDPCHCVVAGLNLTGEAFCCPECYFWRCVRNGVPIAPRTLLIRPRRRAERLVQVVPLTVNGDTSSSPLLVHLAAELYVNSRADAYLRNVARRSGAARSVSPEFVSLTDREKEILLRLVEDDSISAVAGALNISYHTVRNHVQHVIKKLGAHSVEEAIARFLTRWP